jgi:YesN/AraC family two-component response regulator
MLDADVENTPKGPGIIQLAPIDVLLLDVQMPKLNGMQVVGCVRNYIKNTNEKI